MGDLMIVIYSLIFYTVNGAASYYTGPTKMTWFNARDYCTNQGDVLASIHSLEENQEAYTKCNAVATSPGGCWIGLSDLDMEGIFIWSDDTNTDYGFTGNNPSVPTTGIYPWGDEEPNDINGGENCIQLYTEDSLLWNDAGCYWQIHFLCKVITSNPTKLPTTSPTPPPTTKQPSASPASNPTIDPSTAPTEHPSSKPTLTPTKFPSRPPTTSSTTNPTDSPTVTTTNELETTDNERKLECGDNISGNYNDEWITFHVQMPYDGNLTFDAGETDFSIAFIEALSSSDDVLGHDSDHDDKMTLIHQTVGEYKFKMIAPSGTKGIFRIKIQCEKAEPETPAIGMSTTTQKIVSHRKPPDTLHTLYIMIIAVAVLLCCICSICAWRYFRKKLTKKSVDEIVQNEPPLVQEDIIQNAQAQNIRKDTSCEEEQEEVDRDQSDVQQVHGAVVAQWLKRTVKLPEYVSAFLQNGYDSLNTIARIQGVQQLEEIGVINIEHQKLFLIHIADLNLLKIPNTIFINKCSSDSILDIYGAGVDICGDGVEGANHGEGQNTEIESPEGQKKERELTTVRKTGRNTGK